MEYKIGFGGTISVPHRPLDPKQWPAMLNGWVFDGSTENAEAAYDTAKSKAEGIARRQRTLDGTTKKSCKAANVMGKITVNDFIDIGLFNSWYDTMGNLATVRADLKKQCTAANSLVRDLQKTGSWDTLPVRSYSGDAINMFIKGHCNWSQAKGKTLNDLVDRLVNALVFEAVIVESYRENLLQECRGARVLRQYLEQALDPISSLKIQNGPSGKATSKNVFLWHDKLRSNSAELVGSNNYAWREPSHYLHSIATHAAQQHDLAEIDLIIQKIIKSPASEAWNFDTQERYKGTVAADVVPAMTALYRVRNQ
jgi:hypothetical protein